MIKSFITLLRNLVPRSIIRLLKKTSVTFSSADVERTMNNPESINHRELLKKINLKRSVCDEMYDNKSDYLQVGLSAIQCIEAAINKSGVNNIKQILDMPCGYGRVLRFIAEFFPNSELTACDTNKDSVDFCKKEFRAHPVYSKHNLKEFNIGRKFDLIWCGSLATHFDSNNTLDLLNFFHRHLNVEGILVFSMHGGQALEFLRTRNYTYALDDESIEKILSETKETGYGYANYPGAEGYGISVATQEWMKACLDRVGKWRDYRFAEAAWVHHHDIYSVVKA